MDRLAVVQKYLDAWQRRDWAGMSALFGEHGDYQDPYLKDPLVGGLSVASYSKNTWRGLPDIRFDVWEIIPAGANQVTLHYAMRGTNLGPIGDYPATGRALDIPALALITVEGDRIRSVRNYYDRARFGSQLGHADYRRLRGAGAAEGGPLSVINPYIVPAGQEAAFIEQWDRRIQWLKQQPGFLDARLHRSIDPQAWFPFVSVTVWDGPENLERAMKRREFRELWSDTSFTGHPGIYGIEVKH